MDRWEASGQELLSPADSEEQVHPHFKNTNHSNSFTAKWGREAPEVSLSQCFFRCPGWRSWAVFFSLVIRAVSTCSAEVCSPEWRQEDGAALPVDVLKQAVWQFPQGTALGCSFCVLPSCSSVAKSESRSLRVLLSIWSLNSASVLHRPASFPGMRPRFGVQEVGPACKCRAGLSLPISSSTNNSAAAEQGSANTIFTAQKVALGFELNFPRFFVFLHFASVWAQQKCSGSWVQHHRGHWEVPQDFTGSLRREVAQSVRCPEQDKLLTEWTLEELGALGDIKRVFPWLLD